MFTTQGEAKRFFVDKIVSRAAAEGVALSDAERRMLSFSKSDPEFVVDLDLVQQLSAEMDDDEYETKMAGLIARACGHDVTADPAALQTYLAAYSRLREGDHYLVVLLTRGLSTWLPPWWAFWR